jgi:signal transduction histidine kinase
MSIALHVDDYPASPVHALQPRAARVPTAEQHDIVERLSHELRTPLNSVIGFSRMLRQNRKGNQCPSDLKMLEAIRTNGERLLGLVEDLVALSITQSMPSEASPPYANVVAIASEVVAQWREQAELRGLTLTLKVESYDLVRIDPVRFAKLLDKLVCNAIKFTPAGSVTVTIGRPNGWAAPGSLIVSDTGIGMSPGQLTTIFEPFSQAEGSTTRRYEGAGLGLPIARTLAMSMGCSMDVKSELGKGTRFEVVFRD